nr:MAG TPA: hypothetical protein [Caudoviricetes sp.]
MLTIQKTFVLLPCQTKWQDLFINLAKNITLY